MWFSINKNQISQKFVSKKHFFWFTFKVRSSSNNCSVARFTLDMVVSVTLCVGLGLIITYIAE